MFGSIGTLYDPSDFIDKTLVAKIDLPVYDGYPTSYHPNPSKIGTVKAGATAGVVYSWIDSDPANNRPQIWWMFYPGSSGGSYYFIPHGAGYFDLTAIEEQGIQSEEQKNQQPETWYEKILSQVLPVVAISILGAAAIKGFFSSRHQQ